MKPEEFTQWLRGFLDAAGSTLTNEQIKQIKSKLDSVFNKVTPPNDYSTTYCQSTIPTFPNYTMIDNGNEPSGIVWSGRNPTPYLGGEFSNFITC